MLELFKTEKDCCGCYACINICPKQAIGMKQNKDGFMYPEIMAARCKKCGLCREVCAFQKIPITTMQTIAAYAAINKNQETLFSSASGGVFGALASIIIERNGVVFGCAYTDRMETEHIAVDNLEDIKRLQGSKYVQSHTNTTFIETKQYLDQGRAVLYSGTPCQIAGLKAYLGKDYEGLLTVDLICHGVPSSRFFKDYIECLELELKGQVIDFIFRDKSKGWGLMGKVVYKKAGGVQEKVIPPIVSYYYHYFLNGDSYRECCYECKYACGIRQGDFTIGDYWGIKKAHPEIDTSNGVSVLLVNSDRGMRLIKLLSEYLHLTPSTFAQAQAENGQLKHPTRKSARREEIFRIWREGGSKAVAIGYYRANKKAILRNKIAMAIPQPIKRGLNMIIGDKR